MKQAVTIVWFRQDLRLCDHPALLDAGKRSYPILPLFILDDVVTGEWQLGRASRWWLHQSLMQLNNSLAGKLCLQIGDALEILKKLSAEYDVQAVCWQQCYEPFWLEKDQAIKTALAEMNIETRVFNSSVLFQPQHSCKKDGTPYKVFTPYYRSACLQRAITPLPAQASLPRLNLYHSDSVGLDALQLEPKINWHQQMAQCWTPGEAGARRCLQQFLQTGLSDYKIGRDFPARSNVSRLSPHLHFGEIAPSRVWQAVQATMVEKQCEKEGEHFLRELAWREFSNHLLYHFPALPRKNLQIKFDQFPWRDDAVALKCWQTGQTGYPIIDAGMRELWQTGYIHNRVRMLVGSFLVKNLLLHWHHGENWFWDTLVDADLANNSVSWQWVAGSGADAAPYFRIFNPVKQGQKFDPDGDYVRCYVPEIKSLPDKFLHAPWLAPASVLATAKVKLGLDYPLPIVDLKASRERALAAFKSLSMR